MKKLFYAMIIINLLLLVSSVKSYGNTGDEEFRFNRFEPNFEIESEYLTPIQSARQIDTASMNLLFRKNDYISDNSSVYLGITITRAWGDIIRPWGKVDNSAWGIGPMAMKRYQLMNWDKSCLSFESSVGLILYNEDFPAGGEFYNFMWRIGPKYTCYINENSIFSIGYKLMHVSNGQFSGNSRASNNPAYNAKGISISITRKF